jgi:hypothetical protein
VLPLHKRSATIKHFKFKAIDLVNRFFVFYAFACGPGSPSNLLQRGRQKDFLSIPSGKIALHNLFQYFYIMKKLLVYTFVLFSFFLLSCKKTTPALMR